ncbi:hypothetical protein GcC1_203022 [Golovinomyces cichoracearum]|uniref:Uncharacterized protein n=1 Tax=Golovinomyces cichoracearum TaxID=62708 RepID=A0A420HDJ2_9PEZI|nr:hypothetical protein GcC1_203022 [Golovinomyces cichoracearum]
MLVTPDSIFTPDHNQQDINSFAKSAQGKDNKIQCCRGYPNALKNPKNGYASTEFGTTLRK